MAHDSQEPDSSSDPFKNLNTMRVTPLNLSPYNWLKDAQVYNKMFDIVPYQWFVNNSDVIVAFFTAKGVKFKDLVPKFYETYENAKLVNLPIEVIYIPMDETDADFQESFEEQANWFTLKLNDNLIPLLQFMYGISSIPCLIVTRVDGTVISQCGLRDLEEYGRNVLITWLSSSSNNKTHRRLSRETMYGPVWRYLTGIGPKGQKAPQYHRKFSVSEVKEDPPLVQDPQEPNNS